MNKLKLLDQLIDEIALIDTLAFELGISKIEKQFYKAYKDLVKHKNIAFHIIEKLKML